MTLSSRRRIGLDLVLVVHEFDSELASIYRSRFFNVLFLLVSGRQFLLNLMVVESLFRNALNIVIEVILILFLF